MKKKLITALAAIVTVTSLVVTNSAFALTINQKYKIDPTSLPSQVEIPAPSNPIVSYEPIGGKIMASNAPESLSDSVPNRGVLYEDTLDGRFRVWASHQNTSSKALQFALVFRNTSTQIVRLYKNTSSGTGVGHILTASSTAANAFMNSSTTTTSNPNLPTDGWYVDIPVGGTFKHVYAASVGIKTNGVYQSAVHISEWKVQTTSGGIASISVADVVSLPADDPITYSLPFSDGKIIGNGEDYRGVLAHYARQGTINVQLTTATPNKFMSMHNYPAAHIGEQEQLVSKWSPTGVKYSTPTAQPGRYTYWFTEYKVTVNITYPTGKTPTTLFGSYHQYNPTHGGYVNYQTAAITSSVYSNNFNGHFNYREAFAVSNSANFKMRLLSQPANGLPLGIWFVTDQTIPVSTTA